MRTPGADSEKFAPLPESRDSMLSDLKSLRSSHTNDLLHTGRIIPGSTLNSQRSEIKLPQITKTELSIRIRG